MQCQKCSVRLCKLYFVELAGAMSQVLGVPACHGPPLTCYSTPCSRNATLTFNQIQPEYNKHTRIQQNCGRTHPLSQPLCMAGKKRTRYNIDLSSQEFSPQTHIFDIPLVEKSSKKQIFYGYTRTSQHGGVYVKVHFLLFFMSGS